MKKLLITLATSSCMFSPFTTVSNGNVPQSTHIPSYTAPDPLHQKLQGTIWKSSAGFNNDYYLFFDSVEKKYAIISLPKDKVPVRYPDNALYIRFSVEQAASANQEVLKKETAHIIGIREYFGISLKSTGLGLQTASGIDVITINATLTAQNGTEWQLYQ